MDLKINLPPPRHTIVPFLGKIGNQKNLQRHLAVSIRDVGLGIALRCRISIGGLVPLFRHIVIIMTF